MLPTRTRTFRPRSARDNWSDVGTDVSRVFDELFNRPLGAWSTWTPAADLYETDEDFVLELELPGFNRDEIEVTVERGILTVSGQRAAEEEQERYTYHVRERSFDRFSRSFSLPHTVNADHVKADFNNGMLRVTLPKAAEAKPRRIEVSGK